MKKYAVYSHSYNGMVFYVGAGRIYEKEDLQRNRPYDFHGRSSEWYEFCNNKTDQIKVDILFQTNNRKLSFDKEEEITRIYIEKGFPLVNKNIGTHFSEETKQKISKSTKGKESHRKGKNLSEEHSNNVGKALLGRKHSKEALRKISEGRTPPTKVKAINNRTQEIKIFSNIKDSYYFINELGFKPKVNAYYKRLRKGPYNFNEYTFERMEEAS